MADPVAILVKFQSGEPLSHQELQEATLSVLLHAAEELEHVCNRLGLLLNAQGVDVSVVNPEAPSPNGGTEPSS